RTLAPGMASPMWRSSSMCSQARSLAVRPVLNDSFDKTREVLEHIQNSMSAITEMLVEGSSKLNPDKLNKLRKAQEIFAEVCAFTQRYQDCLLDVNKDFERARLKLIIPRDNTLFRETLEKGALKPLLSHSPDTVEKEIDGVTERLLAPRRQDDDRHILFDLEALLNLYLDRFEQALPHEIQDPTDQPVAIETNLRGIPEYVIKKCSDWVSDRLKNWGHVSFRDVFDAYECEELSEQEQQVCLLHIGSLAANSDPAIKVEIDDAIETTLWRANNIKLLTVAPLNGSKKSWPRFLTPEPVRNTYGSWTQSQLIMKCWAIWTGSVQGSRRYSKLCRTAWNNSSVRLI
ncbi:hypothetical protein AB3X33_27245, partial [Raoultella terrigena]